MKQSKKLLSLALALVMGLTLAAPAMAAEETKTEDGKIVIELVHYKPGAVDVFEQLEEEFNRTHDDILLKII